MVHEETPPVLPQPDTTALTALQAIYDQGRFLDAWNFARAFASVGTWSSTPALILGGRLASRWGDDVLSNRLHIRAHRQSPDDDDAFYYYILSIHAKHGAFEALRLLTARTAKLTGRPATRAQADLWLQQARLLGSFRDFDAAEICLTLVESALPNHPWLWVEKSGLLREQDRYEESLSAAQHAARLHPWYRPAIHAQVHLLQLLRRDDEALALLEESRNHLQCAALLQTHVLALEEKSRNEDLLAVLDGVGPLQPLAAPSQLRWRAARRCDALLRLGNETAACAAAREAGPGYYEEIVKRLSAPPMPDTRRVQLPLGFIRQHHMTCAPATMSALSHYWERPVDHAELARAICYDGTPAHLERAWAEEHGWLVREFRVTWDSARALLDRGCPFALVTVGIRSGHMQAVLGYDARIGTLLIRDPYQRSYSEWRAESLFETHATSGPRGMILIPPEKAPLLDGIDLPDEPLHTAYHGLQLALSRHERPAAGAHLATLETLDADHRLTAKARFELAYYDANPAQALPPVRRLRERFPDDVNLQLDELQLLEQLGHTVEHREQLRRLAGRPSAPLVFQRQEAGELLRDARHHPRAFKLLRRSLRRHASDAATLSTLADLLWNTGRHGEATRVYRLAACAADKTESHWTAYFKASRHLLQTDESLALLRRRFDHWGERSSQPARTLFDCFEALDRSHEAFDLLEKARARRPDDCDLLLFAAEACGRYGRHAEAGELMQAARPRASAAAWRRTSANLAGYQGDHALALAHWREISALNPADTFAHSSIARLLAIVESRDAALRHLDEACDRQPHLLPLRQTQIQWLRNEDAARQLAALDALLALDPVNDWACREKALALQRLRRNADALACADEALRIAPFAPASHGIRAQMLKALDRLPEAREGCRAGIRLSIDADWLFADLLALCPDFSTRREAVAFIQDELLRQPSLDNAALQFRSVARSILSAQELQTALETLWTRHPETWSCWSVLTQHLLDRDLLPEALAKASDAASRFPLTPRIWLDLANVHARRDDPAAAVCACEKALAINPAWGSASRQLSKIHERTLHLDLAAQVLRRAITFAPTDAYNHGWLADVLWRQHEPRAAIESLEKALSLSPDYDWAWSRLNSLARETGEPDRALRLAETFTRTRSGEAESWLRLVRMRFADHHPGDNLAALDRAAALAPRNPDVYDLRAEFLAKHKRYDEALAACRPAVFGNAIPHVLAGRAAWLEYHRGRLAVAIDRMSAVTAAHPDYTWGWALLTEWYWEDNKFENVKTAAARWAWLAPDAALPHGYTATVHKRDGRKKDAKESLARSLLADPAYEFGAFDLLRLQLDDSELDDARQTLRHIETHFSPADHLRAVLLHQRACKERKATADTLGKLGRLPGLPSAVLRDCVNIVTQAGWERQIETAFAPLLADPAIPAELGRHWMRTRQKKSLWLTLWKVRRLRPTPEHRREIDFVIIEMLGEAQRILTLRLFCVLRRRTLRAHDTTWGQVGYAFNTSSRYRSVVHWMSDWRERPHAPPWMRFNLIQALYSRKKPAHAREALIAALECPPDHTHDQLLGWLAIEQALDGDTAAALATTDRINASEFSDYYKALGVFTHCLTEVQKAAPDAKHEALYAAKIRLRTETDRQPAIFTGPALSQFYRRTLRRLGRDGGSLWWRLRSRLPHMKPTQVQGSLSIPAPLLWVMIILGLGLLRGCAALM